MKNFIPFLLFCQTFNFLTAQNSFEKSDFKHLTFSIDRTDIGLSFIGNLPIGQTQEYLQPGIGLQAHIIKNNKYGLGFGGILNAAYQKQNQYYFAGFREDLKTLTATGGLSMRKWFNWDISNESRANVQIDLAGGVLRVQTRDNTGIGKWDPYLIFSPAIKLKNFWEVGKGSIQRNSDGKLFQETVLLHVGVGFRSIYSQLPLHSKPSWLLEFIIGYSFGHNKVINYELKN